MTNWIYLGENDELEICFNNILCSYLKGCSDQAPVATLASTFALILTVPFRISFSNSVATSLDAWKSVQNPFSNGNAYTFALSEQG